MDVDKDDRNRTSSSCIPIRPTSVGGEPLKLPYVAPAELAEELVVWLFTTIKEEKKEKRERTRKKEADMAAQDTTTLSTLGHSYSWQEVLSRTGLRWRINA